MNQETKKERNTFLRICADLLCSKGSVWQGNNFLCNLQHWFPAFNTANQQEADWFQDAEIIQNHFMVQTGTFPPKEFQPFCFSL